MPVVSFGSCVTNMDNLILKDEVKANVLSQAHVELSAEKIKAVCML